MSTETREREEKIINQYHKWCQTTGVTPYFILFQGFAAGFAAGLAHAPAPAEPFVCDICGQPAIIGLRKNPGARLRRWCVDHFPEVERDA